MRDKSSIILLGLRIYAAADFSIANLGNGACTIRTPSLEIEDSTVSGSMLLGNRNSLLYSLKTVVSSVFSSCTADTRRTSFNILTLT